MADFAKWAVACEGTIFEAGAFMQTYTGNRADAIESVIDASPVASAIRALMQCRGPWEGTPTELLTELEREAGNSVTKGKEWPTNGQALSRRLNRVKYANGSSAVTTHRESQKRLPWVDPLSPPRAPCVALVRDRRAAGPSPWTAT